MLALGRGHPGPSSDATRGGSGRISRWLSGCRRTCSCGTSCGSRASSATRQPLATRRPRHCPPAFRRWKRGSARRARGSNVLRQAATAGDIRQRTTWSEGSRATPGDAQRRPATTKWSWGDSNSGGLGVALALFRGGLWRRRSIGGVTGGVTARGRHRLPDGGVLRRRRVRLRPRCGSRAWSRWRDFTRSIVSSRSPLRRRVRGAR